MMLHDAETSSLLRKLKAATRAEHDAIEADLDLMSPRLTRAAYHRHLQRCHGFYVPIESLIAAAADWPQWRLDITARAKADWLAADLDCLSDKGEVAAVTRGALPICSELPLLDTAAAAFGCLYVLEGATLGGRVISRHIELVLGLDATHGARFFHGYGAQTGAMWKTFRAALSGFAEESGCEDAVVTSAIATFSALRAWCASVEVGHALAGDRPLRVGT